MRQWRFPCSESAWMTCACNARCCVSRLGMVHMASGRGKKRNQVFAVLFLVSSVICRKLSQWIGKTGWRLPNCRAGRERHCTIARALREGGSNNPPASSMVLGEGVAERFRKVNLLRLTPKRGGCIHRHWKIPSCVSPESSRLSVMMVEANKKPDTWLGH